MICGLYECYKLLGFLLDTQFWYKLGTLGGSGWNNNKRSQKARIIYIKYSNNQNQIIIIHIVNEVTWVNMAPIQWDETHTIKRAHDITTSS